MSFPLGVHGLVPLQQVQRLDELLVSERVLLILDEFLHVDAVFVLERPLDVHLDPLLACPEELGPLILDLEGVELGVDGVLGYTSYVPDNI